MTTIIVFNGTKYDFLFYATYGKRFPLEPSLFDLCITLIYERKDKTQIRCPSLPVVDGDFFSIYPYYYVDKNLFTLTHVRFTPMFSSTSIRDFEMFSESITFMCRRS